VSEVPPAPPSSSPGTLPDPRGHRLRPPVEPRSRSSTTGNPRPRQYAPWPTGPLRLGLDPRPGSTVIDDGLGQEAASRSRGRPGFQRLPRRGRPSITSALILGLEMSRLGPLLQGLAPAAGVVAVRFRVLLADADGLYDPTEHSESSVARAARGS